jgi:hypothetical protein
MPTCPTALAGPADPTGRLKLAEQDENLIGLGICQLGQRRG